MSTRRGVPGSVIRDALTAVYHLTGDDQVSYGNVTQGLRAMLADGVVERVDRGYWQAVTR